MMWFKDCLNSQLVAKYVYEPVQTAIVATIATTKIIIVMTIITTMIMTPTLSIMMTLTIGMLTLTR